MRRIVFVVLLMLCWLPFLASATDIISVFPDPATVGGPVTIIGGPFTAPLTVVLGGQEISPKLIDQSQLVFVVPPLNAGAQALYLQADGNKTTSTYSFRVNLPIPRIDLLEPANIDECSTENDRLVTVNGAHFRGGAQLLLGGQVVPSNRVNESELHFTVPGLKAGTYGVQVVNADGSQSLPFSLWLNNIPEIYTVRRGEDFVNSYQLIISGKNFAHNAALIIYEYPVGQADLPPQQRIIPVQGDTSFHGDQRRHSQTEAFAYLDCNTLIYNRFPYSSQDKRIILRVGNPDGKQTDPYELFTP